MSTFYATEDNQLYFDKKILIELHLKINILNCICTKKKFDI